jgi:hypothetical protein
MFAFPQSHPVVGLAAAEIIELTCADIPCQPNGGLAVNTKFCIDGIAEAILRTFYFIGLRREL